MGYTVGSKEGNGKVQSVNNIHSLPTWLDRETSALIKEVISLLSERHTDLVAVILYGSVARHEERSLEVPNPSICPHGQPILIKISTLELDKKFEREYASR